MSKQKNLKRLIKKASSKPSKEKIMMDNLDKDYDYLLSMKIWSLTAEHIEALKKKLAEKKEELDNLTVRTPRDMWEEDLDFFMELWDIFEKELNDFENNVGKTSSKKKIKMPTLHANARLKAKQRAVQRAKDRENGKDEMSVDEPSEESASAIVVVKKDTTINRSKTLGPKSAPISKSKTNNSTKVTLKKKDEILTKKGKRTLHDYFSMDTSNSASVSPKKKGKKDRVRVSISSSESLKKPVNKKSNLSKSQVPSTKDKTKAPPKRKKSQSERKSDSSYYYTESSPGKTDKTSKTERSDSDSVFDSGDNAPSESDTSDSEVTLVSKKPVPRNNNKSDKKTYSESD